MSRFGRYTRAVRRYYQSPSETTRNALAVARELYQQSTKNPSPGDEGQKGGSMDESTKRPLIETSVRHRRPSVKAVDRITLEDLNREYDTFGELARENLFGGTDAAINALRE